jgi:hypothetical protein
MAGQRHAGAAIHPLGVEDRDGRSRDLRLAEMYEVFLGDADTSNETVSDRNSPALRGRNSALTLSNFAVRSAPPT